MGLYKPNTKVTSTSMPYLALVTAADPQFERLKHREVEYEFQGRVMVADSYVRGANNSNSGIYPVGQPYGGLDPLVVAARPMFSGTPDGKGWA